MNNGKIRFAFLARVMFPLFALSAIVLGMWGFLEDPRSWKSWHEAAIKTLQIFVINVSPSDMKTIEARIASLLAPAATIGAAFFAFSAGLRRNYWILRLRFLPPRNLFIGNGETAAAIATYWARQSGAERPLSWYDCNVGLDCLTETPLSQSAAVTSGRWFLQQGDACSPRDLRRLNAGGAENIWILTGDDVRNLEIARRIKDTCLANVTGEGRQRHIPRLLIAVNDRETIRVRHTLLGDSTALDLEFLSIPRLTARALLMAHPPRTGGGVVNIAVVGGGTLAEAIIVQAATHLIYSENPHDCIRISLIGAEAQQLFERIARAFPVLDPASERDPAFASLLPLAKLSVHACAATDIQPAAWLAMQTGAAFSAIYVAEDDDLATVGATMRVAALRDVAALPALQPIVACLRHDGRSASIDFAPKIESCKQFRLFEEFHSGETYPGEERDHWAKLVNHAHRTDRVDRSMDRSELFRQADEFWKQANYENRWSSRLSADHFDVKLATVGLSRDELNTPEGQRKFESAMSVLARLEHRRFVAERLLDGWLPYAKSTSNVPSLLDYGNQKDYLRLNITLVPFDALEDKAKAKDPLAIKAMLGPAYMSKPRPGNLQFDQNHPNQLQVR